jgi:peptide/nickel transport system ATP-binding protein
MLDVSIRLGVLNLLRELSDQHLLATMYITHDIASARYIADETAVMYAGQVVEQGRGTVIMDSPVHPYTQLLISSVPNPEDLSARHDKVETTRAATTFNYAGCRFSPRCPVALDICHGNNPPEAEVAPGHIVRCWLPASDEQRQEVSIRSR